MSGAGVYTLTRSELEGNINQAKDKILHALVEEGYLTPQECEALQFNLHVSVIKPSRVSRLYQSLTGLKDDGRYYVVSKIVSGIGGAPKAPDKKQKKGKLLLLEDKDND